MITMQFQAPVGYGVRHVVVGAAKQRSRNVVWVCSMPEVRRNIEHSLGCRAISPRQLLREVEQGYGQGYDLLVVSDLIPMHMAWMQQLFPRKDMEFWLVNIKEVDGSYIIV